MNKVLVFGTFDGLHEGHIDFFRQAKEYGDFLVAVVARDSTVLKNKGKNPKFKERERLEKVQECKLVNEAILGEENHDTKNSKFDLISKINPNTICLGYDQETFLDKLKQELKRMNLEKIKIYILKAFHSEKYKSSILNK